MAASVSARNRSASRTGADANAARTSSRDMNARRRSGMSCPIGVPFLVTTNDSPCSTLRIIAPDSLRSSRCVISRGTRSGMPSRLPLMCYEVPQASGAGFIVHGGSVGREHRGGTCGQRRRLWTTSAVCPRGGLNGGEEGGFLVGGQAGPAVPASPAITTTKEGGFLVGGHAGPAVEALRHLGDGALPGPGVGDGLGDRPQAEAGIQDRLHVHVEGGPV